MEHSYFDEKLVFSGMYRVWGVLRSNIMLTIGILLFVLISMMAVMAPVISPHEPAEIHFEERLSPPSASFPLGTDRLEGVFSAV